MYTELKGSHVVSKIKTYLFLLLHKQITKSVLIKMHNDKEFGLIIMVGCWQFPSKAR